MSSAGELTPLRGEALEKEIDEAKEHLAVVNDDLLKKQNELLRVEALKPPARGSGKDKKRAAREAYELSEQKYQTALERLKNAERALQDWMISESAFDETLKKNSENAQLRQELKEHANKEAEKEKQSIAQELAQTEMKRTADEADAKRAGAEADAKRVADEADEADAKCAADKVDAKRAADEADAKRAADEADAKHAADEADAKRAADKADAKRVADEADVVDEADAKRVVDEADVKRVADEADAKHAADKADAKRVVDEADVKRVADDADAKHAADEVDAKSVAADKADAKLKADEAAAERKARKKAAQNGEDSIAEGLKNIDEKVSTLSEDENIQKLKRPRTEGPTLAGCSLEQLTHQIATWEHMIAELELRLSSPNDLEDEEAKSLRHAKANSELGLASLQEAYRNALEELNSAKPEVSESVGNEAKKYIEDKWRYSFLPEARTATNLFPEGPKIWRETLEAKQSKENAEKAIDKFLADPEKNVIPADLRRLMRCIQEFAPRSGTTTRELALHVHHTALSKKVTCNCRWHGEKRGNIKHVDGPTAGKFIISGVAFAKGTKKLVDGFMSCGCEIDAALWDFFWWKTWEVRSGNPKITEPETMKSDILEPRHRAFFIQAYAKGTLLSLADLYSQDLTYGSPEYLYRIMSTQAERLVGLVNTLPVGLGKLILAREPSADYDMHIPPLSYLTAITSCRASTSVGSLAAHTLPLVTVNMGNICSSWLPFKHVFPISSTHSKSGAHRSVDYQTLPPYPTPSYLYIDSIEEANRHLCTVQDNALVGLDLEWVDLPDHKKLTQSQKKQKLKDQVDELEAGSFVLDWDQVPICIAQIATEDKVYVMNLHVMGDVPAEFLRICESSSIVKVAPGIFSVSFIFLWQHEADFGAR
ncbi:hypothetical protein B0H10DRAFT_1952815 [Mycena sp. CBHHK59/15]|nr:hypothetical protein B0H10DRAFT_1952815 [Mycena sp. CBHHK59/15]